MGARLRELRLEAELTQAEVAWLSGIQRPIVSRIERGTHCTTLEVVQRYAEALELDLVDVLTVMDAHHSDIELVLRSAA